MYYPFKNINMHQVIQTYKTPLVVYDVKQIEKKLEEYKNNFQSPYFETEVVYASKAFLCGAMISLLIKNGTSLDVVSGGELYIAKSFQFPMESIYFHGNNKTDDELEMAFDLKVKTLVLDNISECKKIIKKAEERKQNISVLIRVNPLINAHTHAYIQTATKDTKFGIPITDENTILDIINEIKSCAYVQLEGLHYHIGSQILEVDPFLKAIEKTTQFIKHIQTVSNITIKLLNIGGGYGVRYKEDDQIIPASILCRKLIEVLETCIHKYQLSIEKVCMEPGRSIVAEAGYTFYEIGTIKEMETKTFVFVDGGMTDNIRVALYQAQYECDIINKLDWPKVKEYTIAGKCCESGDILLEHAALPKVSENDILVMYSTGAYGYSMSSNYNKLRKPAVLFIEGNSIQCVIRRESYQDLLKYDQLYTIKEKENVEIF